MTDEQFEEQYALLCKELDEQRLILNEIHQMMFKADQAITGISDQVNPLIEDIRTGGVMKLLSGGLGKKK